MRPAPQPVAGVLLDALGLSSDESFVLGCVDGTSTADDIAAFVGRSRAEIEQILGALAHKGAVRWGQGGDEPVEARDSGSSSTGSSIPAGRLVFSRPPPEPAPSRSLPELEEDVDLDLERRKKILLMFQRLPELSYYEVLEIPANAAPPAIRRAYFELSKLYHPDTMFGKRLGSFKPKMEAIFKLLTEAYDTLRKIEKRQSYDGYIAARSQTIEAAVALESAELKAEEFERQAREGSPPPSADEGFEGFGAKLRSSDPGSDRSPAPVSPTPPEVSSPSSAPASDPDFAKARRRHVAERLAAATGRRVGDGSSTFPVVEDRVSDPGAAAPGTPAAPTPSWAPMDRASQVRMLAGTLRSVSKVTGGPDRAERYLAIAREAETQGDVVSAANSVRLALAVSPGRLELQHEYQRLRAEVARTLAGHYTKLAEYEEKHKKWSHAAESWAKVCEGRPDDPVAFVRVAEAMLEANVDPGKIRGFATRATELAPRSARAHKALGRVFIAATMVQNAKRSLKVASQLDPGDQLVKNLLHQLK